MQRYFVAEETWQNSHILLTGRDVHHIKNVMRMNIGDQIICVKPNGDVASCEIISITDEVVQVRILTWLEDEKELPVTVTIVQGLPKQNKAELIVQKGTELGCHHFLLFEGERSIAKWDKKKAIQRLGRYLKIAKEASEQCHRNQIPTIEFTSLAKIVKEKQKFDIMLFAYEEAARSGDYKSFSTVLQERKPGDHMLIIIGPEGGFSPNEVKLLQEQAVVPVRFGPRILRTETAGIYALASISYHFEELGCT